MRRFSLHKGFRVIQGSPLLGMIFRNGQTIPESGIYRVSHSEHRLPHEVTLLRNQPFPDCAKCGEEVTFEAIRLAPQLSARDGDIVIHELPELESGSAKGCKKRAA
jgi:hypothetical protein